MKTEFKLREILTLPSTIEESMFDESLKVGGTHANFTKYFNFKRLGVHFFRIPPGYRTSRPHAEKCEDEFVYIIDGIIDCWYNGAIKKMYSGEAIGFPAGTGVGHTFINNSQAETLLFVVGERTKRDNLYHFHLEPELSQKYKEKWWFDMPAQTLRGHDGWPGPYSNSFVDQSIPTLKVFDLLKDAKTYSYPNDLETFGFGVCPSRVSGIQSFAFWIERLPPNVRSSWPHAHLVEEEFVFVLEGCPTLWINEQEIQLHKNHAIDFKAGSGLAHALINKTNKDVFYLCVGECETPDDRIFYPLHPQRNEEMKKLGQLWLSCPQISKVVHES